MKQIHIRLTTVSPVILATQNDDMVLTATHDFFNGTTLRGILAGLYIKEQQLGKNAHEDDAFRRIFFGSLRFLPAFPVFQDSRSFVLPLSLQKRKTGDDLTDGVIQAPPQGGIFKSCKGLGVIKGNEIFQVTVPKNISLHMSRSGERERLSGKSMEGNIYNYESIDAGQVFEGAVVGPDSDLQALCDVLPIENGQLTTYVGRSRFAEYGQCCIEWQAMGDIPEPVPVTGAAVYLRLETPLLSAEAMNSTAAGLVGQAADLMNKAFPACHFYINEQTLYAAREEVDNFVGVWAMRRPRQYGLAAGSVFALCKENGDWTKEELDVLQSIAYTGIGIRTEEGFGQLRIWNHGELRMGRPSAGDKQKSHTEDLARRIQSERVRVLAQTVFMRCIWEQARILAYEDTKKLNNLKGKTHMFSRLETMLGSRDKTSGLKDRIRRIVQTEIQAVMERHLHEVRIGSNELYDILTGTKPLPYAKADWKKDLPDTADGFMKTVGFTMPDADSDELFYEYWKWFFRHARKKAVRAGRAD